MPIFPNITIEDRHPVTKAYDAGERFVQPGNLTFFNPTVISTIGDRFIPLGFNDLDPAAWNLWALNNPNRGGKFVHLPGNCSVISSWLEPIIIDAVDWLTPRPKGRILFDLSHNPYVSLDLWDPYNEPYPMMSFRNGLVNHTYSVDKLRTDLTLAKLAPYDMLVVPISTENFTAAEIEMVRTWVMNGGSLFVLADQPFLLNVAAVSDYLISPYDISVNLTAGSSGFAATAVPPLDLHPLHENALYLEAGDSAYLNITGDAYPLWFYDGNIVGAGQEYGEGRVIVSGDINMACDGLDVLLQDNYNYLLNVANWLTAAKAKILVYADHSSDARDPNKVPLKGPVAQALNDLGVPFYMTSYDSYFNMSLFYSSWDMVIFDNNAYWTGSYQLHLMDFVEDGGKLIMSTYSMSGEIDAYFGIDSYSFHDGTPETLYVWNTLHPVFTNPVLYGADNVSSTLDVFGAFGTYALDFNIFANATAIAGFTPTAGSNAGIILSAEGRAIMNGPLLSLYGEDTDDSTYMDAYELWLNEIGFLYFERPTINHPADMTYMETETGNEISWTPVADAGPWEYVVRENGSIIEADHWGGGTITINVDGVNASLTDYQLTVFDNLGYSASDVVVLNAVSYTHLTLPTSDLV